MTVEKERELRSLVTRGVLPGRGRGRSLRTQIGAYDDLVGRITAACPDEGYLDFRVVADEEAGQVEQEHLRLQRLQGVLDWRPFDASPEDELTNLPQKLAGNLRESFRQQLADVWVQVRVVERLVDEVASQFGTDPLKRWLREKLDETKARLLQQQAEAAFLRVDVELREPLEEEVEEMRGWLSDQA